MRQTLIGQSLLVLLLLAMLSATGEKAAYAQTDPVGSFFRSLFGAPKPTTPPPQLIAPAAKPKPAEPVEPKVVELPKNPDAQTILVIGDEQASDLAVGLQVAFADTPSIQVIDKSRDNSGLVRDQGADWPTRLSGLLAERKVDFIVVMNGENDRITFPVALTNGKSEDVRSPKWEELYTAKVRKLEDALKASGKPFFWVGLPPMERPSLSAFASYLNGIYKPLTEQAGGVSVDSWNGFVDEDGHFNYQGPDVDGQMKRLRAYDGFHFTRAGQRKLAFYVETEIRKIMRGETSRPEASTPEIVSAQPKAQAAMLAAPPPLPPAPWDRVGPVMPLEAGSNGDSELAGAPPPRATAAMKPTESQGKLPGGYPLTETPVYARIMLGEPIPAQSGRVDDFTWER